MAAQKLRRSILFGLLPAILTACVIPDDTSKRTGENAVTAAAKTELVGMSEADIRMCAGFPTDTADVGENDKIWTYQRNVPRGNMNLVLPSSSYGVLPAVGGSMNLAPGGYCHMQIRLKDGLVTQVGFAGNNNQPNSLNALCVSLVDSCVASVRQLKR